MEFHQNSNRITKKAKGYILFLLTVFLLAWALFLYQNGSAPQREQYHLQKGNELYEKQILDGALEQYNQVLSINPNSLNAMEQKARILIQEKEYEKAREVCVACEKKMPGQEKNILLWAESYLKEKDYKNAATVLEKGTGKKVLQKKQEVSGKYYLSYVSGENPRSWCNGFNTQVALLQEKGKAVLYDAKGKKRLSGDFDWLSAPSADGKLYAAKQGKTYCYVDEKGIRQLVPEKELSYLGPMGTVYAPAKEKKAYGYIDRSGKTYDMKYEKTYAFADGYTIAKTKNSFVVLDKKLAPVEKLNVDAMVENDYGFASTYGVMIGIKKGKQSLYHADGSPMESCTADEFYLPEERNGWIAFRKGDRWGFLDQEGVERIKPQFVGAKSFSEGYAAVKVEDKWGYIDKTGTLVIPAIFSEAGPISKEGTAWVEYRSGTSLLKLCKYE